MKKFAIYIALILAMVPSVYAATLNWKGTPFFVVTHGMPVKTLLKDFGANYGVPVIVSPLVTDIFIGRFDEATPDKQLELLARTYNLTWFYDGKALYIYKNQEVTASVITPEFDTQLQLSQYVNDSGLVQPGACQLRQIAKSNSYEIYGVPECIRRIKDTVTQLSIAAKSMADVNQHRESVEVFPLKYASATDINYQYRDQNVVIPGVVSVLQQINNSQTVNSGATPTQLAAAESSSQESEPTFSADPRQNAVVVRDREINMPMYQRLITQLDHKQDAIEITVSIIDVNAEDLGALGVDWSANADIGGTNLQFNTNLMGGGSYATSLISNANDFMIRVNALEQKSQAKILSQPSVVTLNNVQAVLDKNTTFYTKLVGEKIAQLASITSGTLMKVTPRVVKNDNGSQEVNLLLSIQDGNQQKSASVAENMPQVQNSEIDTQATLKSGESLLLGGFVQDQDIVTERKIPLLGDIYLIGDLFKSKETTKVQTVRLFLIKAVPLAL